MGLLVMGDRSTNEAKGVVTLEIISSTGLCLQFQVRMVGKKYVVLQAVQIYKKLESAHFAGTC